MKQEFKISYVIDGDVKSVFFTATGFKSAFEHSEDYIARNAGKFPFTRFMLNSSSYGEQWIPFTSH